MIINVIIKFVFCRKSRIKTEPQQERVKFQWNQHLGNHVVTSVESNKDSKMVLRVSNLIFFFGNEH